MRAVYRNNRGMESVWEKHTVKRELRVRMCWKLTEMCNGRHGKGEEKYFTSLGRIKEGSSEELTADPSLGRGKKYERKELEDYSRQREQHVEKHRSIRCVNYLVLAGME